ncbi:unnamed protein product [Anisakis simplex]|uniref:Pecanex-like protein n=1 Tax=Anisakis simplex TaxID=6269 RepID=A0A0M3KG61_ANISI|nr:unnamed protein product [Anisakis simplex]
MQPFILVRFVQLSAQLAALYLLIMIGGLCTKLPFDQFIKEASFECISSLRSVGVNVKGWNMEPESDQYYGLNSEAQLVVEQLREAVEPDVSSNFTATSKPRNQSGDPVIGLLLSSQNSTSSDANMTTVSNGHADSNTSDFLSLNDSLNIFVHEKDNGSVSGICFSDFPVR